MELSPAAARTLNDIAQEYGIRLLVLFGSTVSGKLHPRSDLDLAVLLAELPAGHFFDLSPLAYELQSVFPGREVDIALINRADPLFLKKVTENCELLVGKRSDLNELKMYAFRRYQDHKRFLKMEQEFARSFVQRIAVGGGR